MIWTYEKKKLHVFIGSKLATRGLWWKRIAWKAQTLILSWPSSYPKYIHYCTANHVMILSKEVLNSIDQWTLITIYCICMLSILSKLTWKLKQKSSLATCVKPPSYHKTWISALRILWMFQQKMIWWVWWIHEDGYEWEWVHMWKWCTCDAN